MTKTDEDGNIILQNQFDQEAELERIAKEKKMRKERGETDEEINKKHPEVERLLLVEVPEQRSPGWFAARRKCVTASSAASLLKRTPEVMKEFTERFGLDDHQPIDGKCCNPYSSMKKYIIDKCDEPAWNRGAPPMWWGTMLEQVATDIYSRRIKEEVIEFGLMAHQTLDWLAASPDGITPSGIMLEIKCPWRRKITGIPPFYYWVQMQLQLEACNLEYCDFEECTFKDYWQTGYDYNDDPVSLEQTFLEDILGEGEEKGLIIKIIDLQDPEPPHKYIYPPVDMTDPIELLEWGEETIKKADAAHVIQCYWRAYKSGDWSKIDDIRYTYEFFFWKLVVYSVVRVKREREWFARCGPILKAGWDKVLWHREHGWEELKPQKKVPKPKKAPAKPRKKPMGKTISIVSQLKVLRKEEKKEKRAAQKAAGGYNSSTDSDNSDSSNGSKGSNPKQPGNFMFASDSDDDEGSELDREISGQPSQIPMLPGPVAVTPKKSNGTLIETDSDDDYDKKTYFA